MTQRAEALASVTWPIEEAAEAVACLARVCGYRSDTTRSVQPPPRAMTADPALCDSWFAQLGSRLDLDLTPVEVSYAQLHQLVRSCAPALVAVGPADDRRLLAIARAGERLRVIDREGCMKSLPAQHLQDALAAPHRAGLARQVSRLVERLQLPVSARERARRALVHDRLAPVRTRGVWLLRPSPRPSLSAALRNTGAVSWVTRTLLLYVAQYSLLALAWYAVGRAALDGAVDVGWLQAWMLALASSVPVQTAVNLLGAYFSLDTGEYLRAQLLSSITRLEPRSVQRQGAATLLASVMEAGVFETLGLSGALGSVFASIDLLMALVVLCIAAHSGVWLGFLLVAILVSGVAMRRYLQLRRDWTAERLALTQELVDNIVGHRTRLAQQPSESRHTVEDSLLERYLTTSRGLDASSLIMHSVPRLTFLASLGWLTFALTHQSLERLDIALSFGGVLLATRALSSLISGLQQLSVAAVALPYVMPLLRAPARDEAPAEPTLALAARNPDVHNVLSATGIVLTQPQARAPLLSNVDLRIEAGDRILLEGGSGSGKSSLAYALAGLRPVAQGLLTYNGLDRATLGAAWRQRVTVAPQFQDNHVFCGSLAFNLLLARHWPAEPEDLALAEDVCRELGLGPLLDRMPAGLHQVLGDTGWELSHGERSRLFAARAILSDADLVVLDESLAALDAQTAEAVLRCACARSKALMLVAHP